MSKQYVEECVEFTKADFAKTAKMLRDPRPYCLYIHGRRRGHGLYLKALSEASEARNAVLKKA